MADEALALAGVDDFDLLLQASARRRDYGHGSLVSYSRKVFVPLTKLCRDVCHYCTFAHAPRAGESPYLSHDAVRAIARAGIGKSPSKPAQPSAHIARLFSAP